MKGQTIPQQQLPMPLRQAPRDDVKNAVSTILKRVDQLIHKGDLDHAQLEITKAKEVDPRNAYVFALEERISILKAEFVHLEEIQHTDEPIPSAAIEYFSKPKPEIPNMATSLKPQPATALSTPSIAPTPLPHGSATKPQENRKDVVQDRSVELESYREALTDAWSDGALTEKEERYLSELRTVFDITNADCEQIERNVKYECYRNALLRQQSINSMKATDSLSNTDLQHIFQISDEEHLYVQTRSMNTIQHAQRDKVLVIDDDTRLLELLAASLEDSGFEVIALPTSDEAYTLLRKLTPDIILCDINLETSTMSGFAFYEKVQKLNNVQNIPFLFLTGLTDESLVRTGKELGVDDYLLKPISEQTLVSTLRGKLKRFRQLNRILGAPMLAMAEA
jgi:CheY-like chemotaxis protein